MLEILLKLFLNNNYKKSRIIPLFFNNYIYIKFNINQYLITK